MPVWLCCCKAHYHDEAELRALAKQSKWAMALAESSGYTYHVIKVCGMAVCHKKAEWKGIE